MASPISRARKNPERTLTLTMPSQVSSETVSGLSVSLRGGEAECTNMSSRRLPTFASKSRQPSLPDRSVTMVSAVAPSAAMASRVA